MKKHLRVEVLMVFALVVLAAMVFVAVGALAWRPAESGVIAAPGRADAANEASGVLGTQAERAAVGDGVVTLNMEDPPIGLHSIEKSSFVMMVSER